MDDAEKVEIALQYTLDNLNMQSYDIGIKSTLKMLISILGEVRRGIDPLTGLTLDDAALRERYKR